MSVLSFVIARRRAISTILVDFRIRVHYVSHCEQSGQLRGKDDLAERAVHDACTHDFERIVHEFDLRVLRLLRDGDQDELQEAWADYIF